MDSLDVHCRNEFYSVQANIELYFSAVVLITLSGKVHTRAYRDNFHPKCE